MDSSLIVLVIFLAAIAVMVAVLLVVASRIRRRAKNLRAEISRQRRDALRSINLMLQQMDYDAEVLRLMRHARASRERGNETDFNGAIDTLITKEREMMDRVDRVAEFEGYLQQTYGKKGLFANLGREEGEMGGVQGAGSREQRDTAGVQGAGSRVQRDTAGVQGAGSRVQRNTAGVQGAGSRAQRNTAGVQGAESGEAGGQGTPEDGNEDRADRKAAGGMKVLLDKSGERDMDPSPPATPEELKSDIETFIRDLERIRGGELGLLNEKISFFERWVEGPERKDILRSLRAMTLFLDKGDASGLDTLKNEGAAGRGQGAEKKGKEKN